MTIKYKIFEDLKIVYAECKGKNTFGDLMDHIVELSIDPKYKAPMHKIVDFRKVRGFEFTIDEYRKFSSSKILMSDVFQNERCAFIVNSDLGYGIARQHQALMQGVNIQNQAFWDLEEAKEWLGITIDNDELTVD